MPSEGSSPAEVRCTPYLVTTERILWVQKRNCDVPFVSGTIISQLNSFVSVAFDGNLILHRRVIWEEFGKDWFALLRKFLMLYCCSRESLTSVCPPSWRTLSTYWIPDRSSQSCLILKLRNRCPYSLAAVRSRRGVITSWTLLEIRLL